MDTFSTIKSACVGLLVVGLVGCGATQPQTQEEKELAMQMQKAFLAKLQGGTLMPNQQVQQPQQQPVKQEPTLTEKELLNQKVLVDATGGPATFYRHKDGIMINESMYHDFEGSVSNFGGNRMTGEFTYTTLNADGSHTLKYFKAGSEEAPIKIATIKKSGDTFDVVTVTGKKIPGSNVIPTSDGFIVGRAGSAFRYTIGSNKVKSITMLDGYHIAHYQNGDAASTGYILLEKDPIDKNDSAAGLFNSVRDLGNSFGINKVDDYVLVSLDTGKVIPLDVAASGKDVHDGYNCESKKYYKECKNFRAREALYTDLGVPNYSHYYWSIDWVKTPSGPLAFYKTTTKIKVVDINNGKVHQLFSRALGVNQFKLTEYTDGKVAIQAKLGFSYDKIDDVESFIVSNSENVEPMQTL